MVRKIFDPALLVLALVFGLSAVAIAHPTRADAEQTFGHKAVFDEIALNRLGRNF